MISDGVASDDCELVASLPSAPRSSIPERIHLRDLARRPPAFRGRLRVGFRRTAAGSRVGADRCAASRLRVPRARLLRRSPARPILRDLRAATARPGVGRRQGVLGRLRDGQRQERLRGVCGPEASGGVLRRRRGGSRHDRSLCRRGPAITARRAMPRLAHPRPVHVHCTCRKSCSSATIESS